jgi:hypothetical protein
MTEIPILNDNCNTFADDKVLGQLCQIRSVYSSILDCHGKQTMTLKLQRGIQGWLVLALTSPGRA